MLKDFQKYIADNALFDVEKDKTLLTVSGGIDSMVMTDLFLRSRYRFALAHCNFHLRGEESMRDEAFVREFAQKNGLELFVKDFDTYSYMSKEKKSLEMSARELRYEWFDLLVREHGFNTIATAHHSDDAAETFLINILRGTGIAGLHGILPKSGNIIRPMLFAGRREIEEYALRHNITFVEDSTNKDNKYTRNKIRNEVIPILREIAPNFDVTIRKNIERLRETETVFRSVIDKVRDGIVEKNEDYARINIENLKKLTPRHIFVYEILSEFGFNEANINAICECLDDNSTSGKFFYSEKYRLLRDRKYLFITNKQTDRESDVYLIDDYISNLENPLRLHVEALRDLKFIRIPNDRNIAMIDYDLLKFPLCLRHWKKGDAFFPIGMKGKQKLSDLFTNLKYSMIDKENQWLLCSGEDIVWVLGVRIDDRYKITDKTKTIYKIEIE